MLPMIRQDKWLLILHSYTPSGVRVCPILFVPSYFRLTLSFPPSVIFPFTYYVAMSHSISPSVIFPLSMLLCPTLFPPLLFSLSLCCYVPHYFPPTVIFPFTYVAISPLFPHRYFPLTYVVLSHSIPTFVIFPLPMAMTLQDGSLLTLHWYTPPGEYVAFSEYLGAPTNNLQKIRKKFW